MNKKYEQIVDNMAISLKNIKPKLRCLLFNSWQKEKLGDNKRWRNKFKGSRCFIIGNGPSLNKQNLSPLNDEYIFTVNQIMRSDIYKNLHSNFHVIADPLYFSASMSNEQKANVINNLKLIHPNTHCFFPLFAKDFLKTIDLSTLDISYFYAGYLMRENEKRDINLCKCIFVYNNVVQYAIELAIYMGFKEIYLLGCDMTGYKEIEQYASGKFVENTHVYAESSKEMKSALHNDRTCEEWFGGFAKMFVDYRKIYNFCSDRQVKICNLTFGGVLDSLPREDFNEFLKINNLIENANK